MVNKSGHRRRQRVAFAGAGAVSLSCRAASLLPAWIMALGLLFSGAASVHADEQKKVLVLHSYHIGYPWTDRVSEGIAALLGEDENVEIFFEQMDTKRHHDKPYPDRLLQLYRDKYEDIPLDVIIVSDDNGLNFLLKNRGNLFPGVPVVFCGINNFTDSRIAGFSGHKQGKMAALMARRIIGGESPDKIPIIRKSPNVYTFDYGEISRFGISEKDLPEGSILLNRPFSFYEYYRAIIWTTTAVFIVMLVLILFLTVNIIKRKRTEQSLLENEAFTTSLLENSSIPILVLNEDTSIRYVNPMLEELTGYSAEEIIGRKAPYPWWTSETESGNVPERIEHSAAGVRGTEKLFRKKSGEQFWVELSAIPISHNGKFKYALTNWVDITERKTVEEALRTSEEKYRVLVEESPLGIALIGEEGQYRYINPEFTEIFGYGLQEISPGRAWFEKAYPDAEYRKQVQRAWFDDMTGSGVDQARPRTFAVTCKDGSEKVILFKSVTLASGEQLVIYEDITERRRAEEEKAKLEALLGQAQKMEAIGTLAGGIAHDFNNILQSIMINTELALLEHASGTFDAGRLEASLTASDRAKDLVKQILTFSRQGEQQIIPLQMSTIVKEALKLLRSSLPTTIEIKQNIEAGSDFVLADPTQIHQVMMNLCTNSAHAMMQKGGILEVSLENCFLDGEAASLHPDLMPGNFLRLTVSDNGHGMSHEVIERIFDPFFTTKDRGEGTGMGLAVVHGIVKSCDGAISVESEVGKGTTFEILLPAVESKAQTRENVARPLPGGSEKILIVDDEVVIIDLLKGVLENLNYRVVARNSSADALEAFRSRPEEFDLIITDQTMPHMTGAELAKEVMKIRPDIPIILCTGFSEILSENQAMAIGIREFVMKPVVLNDLADTVRRLLDEKTEDDKTEM